MTSCLVRGRTIRPITPRSVVVVHLRPSRVTPRRRVRLFVCGKHEVQQRRRGRCHFLRLWLGLVQICFGHHAGRDLLVGGLERDGVRPADLRVRGRLIPTVNGQGEHVRARSRTLEHVEAARHSDPGSARPARTLTILYALIDMHAQVVETSGYYTQNQPAVSYGGIISTSNSVRHGGGGGGGGDQHHQYHQHHEH
jgi:hypothetical protein